MQAVSHAGFGPTIGARSLSNQPRIPPRLPVHDHNLPPAPRGKVIDRALDRTAGVIDAAVKIERPVLARLLRPVRLLHIVMASEDSSVSNFGPPGLQIGTHARVVVPGVHVYVIEEGIPKAAGASRCEIAANGECGLSLDMAVR